MHPLIHNTYKLRPKVELPSFCKVFGYPYCDCILFSLILPFVLGILIPEEYKSCKTPL